MGKAVPTVSDAELDVLKVLWEQGPLTVRAVETKLRKRKRRWAYNTVLTLLSRLRDKGFVAADKTGSAHVFRAAVTREELLRSGLSDLADRICDGTSSPLVHALVQGARLTPDEISQLRKMLDQLESKE
jgi:predicted transcriptional regulator